MVFYTNSDGRAFTEYRSFSQIDNKLKSSNKISNNYEYKAFLQKNAESLMEQERSVAGTKLDNPKCDCAKCKKLTYKTFM